MSTKQILSWLVAGAVVLGSTSSAWAQHFQPFGPVDFESDYQLFAPLELDQLGGPMPGNTGFFFTYDRMFTAVSRNDDDTEEDFGGDQAWGNRYELGYMSKESTWFDGSGWLVSVLHVDAAGDRPARGFTNVPDVNLDGVVTDDDLFLIPLNNASSGGVEVMKTWRAERRHYGSIIEPMIGVRWFYVHDDGLEYFDTSPYFLSLPNNFDFDSDNTSNDLVGPQVGVRWFKQNERWIVSAEGRFLAAANFRDTFNGNLQDTEFVPLAEVRFEATYEVFHAAALRVGYTGIFACDGIARSSYETLLNPQLTDEDFTIHALTFGFVFNR